MGVSRHVNEGKPQVGVEVAVVDPLPVFCLGAVAILAEAGHAVRVPLDVLAWCRQQPGALILLTLVEAADWTLLAALHEADHPVVVLLTGESTASGVRAVRAGARSVLPRGASPTVLRRTVSATLEGQAVLPADVAVALAGGGPSDPSKLDGITPEKILWLRALATGMTVARLATQSGYSERAMFRMLKALYREIGVRSRTEALMRAQESGWL